MKTFQVLLTIEAEDNVDANRCAGGIAALLDGSPCERVVSSVVVNDADAKSVAKDEQ